MASLHFTSYFPPVLKRLSPVYYLDSTGSCVPGDLFCVGSGGSLAYGILDSGFSDLGCKDQDGRPARDISVEQAVALAARAIRHATHRDSYSGGYINVFHINETGEDENRYL